MLAGGASNAEVQLMGRWTSDCYLQYLSLSPATLRSIADRMATLHTGDVSHAEHKRLAGRLESLKCSAA